MRIQNLDRICDFLLLGFLVLFLVGHFVFMSSPFVNLESWCAGAARLVYEGKPAEALRYLERTIANPIGAVAGVVPFYWLCGISEFSARLFSLLTGLITVATVYYWGRRFSHITPQIALIAGLITGLNPMFWTYSGLAYTDVPFTLLISSSVVVALVAAQRHSAGLHLLAAMLLAGAALTKYNAATFIPVIVAVVVIETLRREQNCTTAVLAISRVLGLYATVESVVVVPYALWVQGTLGHLLDARYVDVVGLNSESLGLGLTVLRFSSIVVWVGIFSGPLFLFSLAYIFDRIQTRKAVLLLAVILVLSPLAASGYLETQRSLGTYFGEMQLGWVEHLVRERVGLLLIASLLFAAGGVVLTGLVTWALEDSKARYPLALWVLVVLALHSLVRPAYRYVLFVLPGLAIYLAHVTQSALINGRLLAVKRLTVMASLVLFAGLALFQTAYFATEGYAAASVAAYINENQLQGFEFSPFDGVQTHSGYLMNPGAFISDHAQKPRFVLVTLGRNEYRENVVYQAPVEMLGVVFKRYAIVQNTE